MRTIFSFFFLSALLHAQLGLWEQRAAYPLSLTEVSGAQINGKIYMVCGLTVRGSVSDLYIYDPETDSWTAGAPAPIPGGADHCNVAAANGRLYLVGAIRVGTPFVEGRTLEYDPPSNRWREVGTMPTPRGASGVAAIGSRIYVAGGLSVRGVDAAFEAFDTATGEWSRLPAMPTARDHLTAQAVNGRFYAISGRAANVLVANEEFDPGTNAWRARAPIPVPSGGLASGVTGGRIVVFGGEGPSGTPDQTFRDNHEYDPVADTWRRLAPMPTPRHGIYGVAVDGRIFVPGGGPRAGAFYSDVHEVFYPSPAEPPAVAAVRNAASGATEIAAGSLVTLTGSRLSFGRRRATATPLPAELNAVRVRVNGTAVPLLFVGPEQVNFLLPAAAAQGSARAVAENAGASSGAAEFAIREAAPGVFSLDGSGSGQGAILIAGTGLIARATRDAFSRAPRRGETVEIYCTGLGPSVEGRAVTEPRLTIGGVRAEVLFAGTSPGFPGLDQINARVPADSQTGIAVPVTVESGGVRSNVTTMAVVE